MEFKIHLELKSRGFKAGFLLFSDLVIPESSAELDAAIAKLCDAVCAEYADKRPSDSMLIENVRRLFSRCGIDPTKHRPSPEALLRRVLRDGASGFPRIVIPVDIGNFIQLKYTSPLGLYDADQLTPPIEIRLGAPDDSYIAIGNREMHTEGRIVAADSAGVFGSPIADAERAKVTCGLRHGRSSSAGHPESPEGSFDAPATQNLLVIFYVPQDFSLGEPMRDMAQKITKLCDCELVEESVIA
ncbi:MAG: B3/B4 domain-containing protein [bacterium]